MNKRIALTSSAEIRLRGSIVETVTLRAESYNKDKFPAQGWPTTIATFRRNPIPFYGLGWCIPDEFLLALCKRLVGPH